MEVGYVPIDQLAKHLGVSISTVRLWIRNEIIPKCTYIQVGTTYRFSIADVVDTLKNQPESIREEPCQDENENDLVSGTESLDPEYLLVRLRMLYSRFEDTFAVMESIISKQYDLLTEMFEYQTSFQYEGDQPATLVLVRELEAILEFHSVQYSPPHPELMEEMDRFIRMWKSSGQKSGESYEQIMKNYKSITSCGLISDRKELFGWGLEQELKDPWLTSENIAKSPSFPVYAPSGLEGVVPPENSLWCDMS